MRRATLLLTSGGSFFVDTGRRRAYLSRTQGSLSRRRAAPSASPHGGDVCRPPASKSLAPSSSNLTPDVLKPLCVAGGAALRAHTIVARLETRYRRNSILTESNLEPAKFREGSSRDCPPLSARLERHSGCQPQRQLGREHAGGDDVERAARGLVAVKPDIAARRRFHLAAGREVRPVAAQVDHSCPLITLPPPSPTGGFRYPQKGTAKHATHHLS